jgi:hypothetical protein
MSLVGIRLVAVSGTRSNERQGSEGEASSNGPSWNKPSSNEWNTQQ